MKDDQPVIRMPQVDVTMTGTVTDYGAAVFQRHADAAIAADILDRNYNQYELGRIARFYARHPEALTADVRAVIHALAQLAGAG